MNMKFPWSRSSSEPESDAKAKNVDDRAKFRIREQVMHYGMTKWIPEVQEKADPSQKWKLIGEEKWHISKADALKEIDRYKSNVLEVKLERIHEIE